MNTENSKLVQSFLEQKSLSYSQTFSEPIDHILARAGFCSIRSATTFLRNNDVRVGFHAERFRITSRNLRIDSEHTPIFINGEQIPFTEHLYFMMNKPLGVVCSRVSDRHKTIFDILPEKIKSHKMYEHLHCVGRLDSDTSGLVILTTNGVFSNYLVSPKNHVTKTYEVMLRDEVASAIGECVVQNGFDFLTQTDYIEKIKNGIELPPEKKSLGFVTAPAELVWMSPRLENQCTAGEKIRRREIPHPSTNFCTLTIHEGKFHQVRRMFAALGNEVVALKRIAIGGLMLPDDLAEGALLELPAVQLHSF